MQRQFNKQKNIGNELEKAQTFNLLKFLTQTGLFHNKSRTGKGKQICNNTGQVLVKTLHSKFHRFCFHMLYLKSKLSGQAFA